MHRRDRIPNKTDSAFRPPVGFEPKSRRAEISVATGGVERPAFDPPSPGISRDRGGRRRLGECRLGKVRGAGAWRGGDECYNGSASEERDPEAVAAGVHFIHPCGEFYSTIACIREITL